MAMFWAAGAFALVRLAWLPEIGDFGHRFAVCVVCAWIGTAIGSPLRQPGEYAVVGVIAGGVYALLAPSRFP